MNTDKLSIILFLLVTAAFCIWNLNQGLRTGRTWARGFSVIDRRNSPCNYWVAISLWAFVTAGVLGTLLRVLLQR